MINKLLKISKNGERVQKQPIDDDDDDDSKIRLIMMKHLMFHQLKHIFL
jgi:hypothetical protein